MDPEALSSFDPQERRAALEQLAHEADVLPGEGTEVNLHCHTFFSYNPHNYSPSQFAWLAGRRGLAVAGIVDFDVLDGVDEFARACRLLNLRGCAGLETRVYVPELADSEINSPGEPGISYHMGVGFPSSAVPPGQQAFLDGLKDTAQQRNRDLVARVNPFTTPVELDLERDVLPLTPNGNMTERHLCLAYAKRAADVFPDPEKLAAYWSEKLDADASELDLPVGPKLQAAIRARTMKRGGVGYVKPDGGSFPTLQETNAFIAASGAIPTTTWLNGLSDGEKNPERLLEIEMGAGARALNIIPDRNFTPGEKDEKLAKLQEIILVARAHDLPVIVGTEMNAPGLKFVDDFASEELAPFVPVFLEGAHVVYAHALLQRRAGLGYLSPWAENHLPDRGERNDFYAEVGRRVEPRDEERLDVHDDLSPDDVLALCER